MKIYFSKTINCGPCISLQGCDLIIALTHMRDPNDLRLAREVPEINLILGGHDHHYFKQWVKSVSHSMTLELT